MRVPATNTRLYMDDGDIPGHLEGRLPNRIDLTIETGNNDILR